MCILIRLSSTLCVLFALIFACTGLSAEGKGHWAYYVLDPDDYHWYRLEANGTWSDKRGITKVRESVGNDPRTIGRGIYPQDMGFCWVSDGSILEPRHPSKEDISVSKAYPKGFNGAIGKINQNSIYIVTDLTTLPMADSSYVTDTTMVSVIVNASSTQSPNSCLPYDLKKFVNNKHGVNIILLYTDISEGFVFPGIWKNAVRAIPITEAQQL